ncbi:MAG: hypothetical protein ABI382_02165 [Nakamurella sp.]
MTTTTIPDPAPTRTDSRGRPNDSRLLLVNDEQWVRDEFDAIIAAEWPTPPAGRPARRAGVKRPHPNRARWQAADHNRQAPTRLVYPGIGRWGSPRSPPPTTTPTSANSVKGR